MNPPFPYFGEILSFLVAIVWAFAVVLFRKSGETVHPIALNLFKNVLAVVLFVPTLFLFKETLFRPAPFSDYALLMLSGLIGIAIGDTLFFRSLNLLGAGLSAIVESLYSPFIVTLSVLWLGERLTFIQIAGVFMIVSAVLSTLSIRKKSEISRGNLLQGVFWGILATAAMAVGIVMIKPVLVHSPLLWATEIRLMGASIALVLVVLFHPMRRRILTSLVASNGWRYTIGGSFFGAYLAMFIWLGGMKYAKLSVASALNQTSTVFIFIFAAILLREKITLRKVIAISLAVVGAFLVFLG